MSIVICPKCGAGVDLGIVPPEIQPRVAQRPIKCPHCKAVVWKPKPREASQSDAKTDAETGESA